MRDEDRTKDELIAEVKLLRKRISVMENSKKLPSTVDSNSLFTAKAFRTMYKNHASIMYIVDLATFRIVDANRAALDFYGYSFDTMLTKRIPDLNITPEKEIEEEIERAVALGRSYYVYKHQLTSGELRDVEIYANPIVIHDKKYSFAIVHDITKHKKADEERESLIIELQSALDEIKDLRGILPICSYCKKVRDDNGFWSKVEEYIQKHSQIDFSHSICPECAHDNYPELY